MPGTGLVLWVTLNFFPIGWPQLMATDFVIRLSPLYPHLTRFLGKGREAAMQPISRIIAVSPLGRR